VPNRDDSAFVVGAYHGVGARQGVEPLQVADSPRHGSQRGVVTM